MTFAPTPEQEAILTAVRDTKENLLIEALAGAAKTSTLVLIAEQLPRTPVLALAFNKRIATEMQDRLPSNCKAQTLNSLGHQAWASHLQARGIKRLTLDKNKVGEALRTRIRALPDGEQGDLWDNYSSYLEECSTAKTSGHLPDRFVAKLAENVAPLLNDDELIATAEEDFSPLEWDIILGALQDSAEAALRGVIDFDDQLLFPALFRVSFPSYPVVLVDEAQDLSILNHVLIRKLVKKGRLIAVGDSFQAIYAFRGAHENSMSLLRGAFSMTTLNLSCSFRCPEAIVSHVQWRAPTMQAWAGNPNSPGEIHYLKAWDASILPDNCAVICRNNAPLLSLATSLLKAGRYPNVWGQDIAKGLLKTLEKLGPSSTPQETAFHLLAQWKEEQLKKAKTRGREKRILDQVACLEIFIAATPTLGEAITYAQGIFNCEGPINLLTGHKSKGHEWNEVFFLDQQLLGDEGQELNLRYVIATRAKRSLTYLTLDGLAD